MIVRCKLYYSYIIFYLSQQPKELFKIRQRQVGSQTKGVITLIGELDFEAQSMYTLTMYATVNTSTTYRV